MWVDPALTISVKSTHVPRGKRGAGLDGPGLTHSIITLAGITRGGGTQAGLTATEVERCSESIT